MYNIHHSKYVFAYTSTTPYTVPPAALPALHPACSNNCLTICELDPIHLDLGELDCVLIDPSCTVATEFRLGAICMRGMSQKNIHTIRQWTESRTHQLTHAHKHFVP